MVNKLDWLFSIINFPLSYILNFFASLLGNNFAAAVFVFTLFINLAMIPLSIKSQKSSVGQMRIKPKLDELKKKYGDDKQRYSMEMQKLYQEENISMSGGCLPLLIRMPFLLAIYYLITQPLTQLFRFPGDMVKGWMEELGTKYEIAVVEKIADGTLKGVPAEVAEKVTTLDFSFLGIDLTGTPKFNINIFEYFNELWLIPLMAFAAQMLTSVLSMRMQKRINPDAPNMAGMMLTMPLISLFIGFTVPAAVGFYWVCSSLISGGIQLLVQYFYGPHKMLAKERANDIVKVYEAEQKYISNRVKKDADE